MDAPSKFFGLESRNGQRKIIHSLRSDDGSSLTKTTEVPVYATRFLHRPFKMEWMEVPWLESAFLADLPQIRESADAPLSADLTLEELLWPS